jgi:hypothetical protein
MHTSHRRSRVKRDTCVANDNPSSNLGRILFPPRRFSCSVPNQRVQWHSVTTVTRSRCVAQRARAPSAVHALVRCSHTHRWGQTKEIYYYYCDPSWPAMLRRTFPPVFFRKGPMPEREGLRRRAPSIGICSLQRGPIRGAAWYEVIPCDGPISSSNIAGAGSDLPELDPPESWVLICDSYFPAATQAFQSEDRDDFLPKCVRPFPYRWADVLGCFFPTGMPRSESDETM